MITDYRTAFLLALAAATSSFAGEKIRFSGTGTNETPVVTRHERDLDRQKPGWLNSDPADISVPIRPAPQAPADRRSQEKLDRERNWIFARPEEFSALGEKQKASESLFPRKSEGVVNRFIQERSHPRNRLPASSSADDENETESEPSRSRFSAKDRFSAETSLFSKPATRFSESKDEKNVMSRDNGPIETPLDLERDQHLARMNEFKKIFDAPAPAVTLPASRSQVPTAGPGGFNRADSSFPDSLRRGNEGTFLPTGQITLRPPTIDENTLSLPKKNGGSEGPGGESAQPKYKPAILPFPKNPIYK